MKALSLSPVLNKLLSLTSFLWKYRIKASETSDRQGNNISFNNPNLCDGFSLLKD